MFSIQGSWLLNPFRVIVVCTKDTSDEQAPSPCSVTFLVIDDVIGERLQQRVSERTTWTNYKHIGKEKQDKNAREKKFRARPPRVERRGTNRAHDLLSSPHPARRRGKESP
jgi:hypothetical protein